MLVETPGKSIFPPEPLRERNNALAERLSELPERPSSRPQTPDEDRERNNALAALLWALLGLLTEREGARGELAEAT